MSRHNAYRSEQAARRSFTALLLSIGFVGVALIAGYITFNHVEGIELAFMVFMIVWCLATPAAVAAIMFSNRVHRFLDRHL